MQTTPKFWFPLLPLLIVAGAVGTTLGSLPPVEAVEFPDGRVAFGKSPRLLGARAAFDTVRVRHVEYYFTVALPADSDEPLKTLTLTQQPNLETIEFFLEETLAFLGTSPRKGEPVAIAAVTQSTEGGPIAVELARPIPPGTTVTVGLVARRNPRFGGIYLFRVRALPQGEKPLALTLGLGRLTFRDSRFSGFGGFGRH